MRKNASALCLLIFATFCTESAFCSISAYFVGNSLSWDALNGAAMSDMFSKGGVELVANYHIRCGSSLSSTYDNPDDPCVVSSDGAWNTALQSKNYDYLVVQPHEGGTTEQEMQAIESFRVLNPSASLVIYEAYPDFVSAADLSGFYNKPDQSRFAQTQAEFSQIKQAYPDALYVPAIEVLLAFDQMARDGEIPGMNSVQDLYRDGRHMNAIGKYLLALTFYTSLTGNDSSATGLELHRNYNGVTSEQALLIQGLVADAIVPVPVSNSTWLFLAAVFYVTGLRRRRRGTDAASAYYYLPLASA